MIKKKNTLPVLVICLVILTQGCTALPEVSEPTPEPTQTETLPLATETPLPPTLTSIPPTPTPTREVISSGNVQRLISIWGYPLPDDDFRTVAFSPDNQILAAGTGQNYDSPDQKLRLLDVPTGQLLAESEKVDSIIWDLAYSPSGSFLAVGLDSGIVQIRGPQDLRQIQQFYFPGPVNSLSISPDGTKLAAGVADNGTGTVFIIDLNSGETLLSFEAHPYSVPDLDYSPDGSLLATGAVDRTVKVWNSATGALIRSLPQDGQGTAVAFSHNGGLLASSFCAKSEGYVCQEGGVLLWSTTTWDLFRSLSGSGTQIEDLDFSVSDDLVAGVDRNGILHFWRVNDGGKLHSLKINSYGSSAVAISNNGLYIADGSAYTLGLRAIGQ
jgi:WD40 repeat protein